MTAVIMSSLRDAFNEGYGKYRILFFSAPCGCGKTTAALALLAGKKVCTLSAAEPYLAQKNIPASTEAVFIDDLQLLLGNQEREELCSLLADRTDLHFVLAGRCPLPGYLMPFKLSGNMTVFERKDLLFDREASLRLMKVHGIIPDQLEMSAICKDMKGYPLGMKMLCNRLAPDEHYCDRIFQACRRDVFAYYDEAVFRRFDRPVRDLLLDLSLLGTFTLELAKMVSGNPYAGELLGILERDTSMLNFGENNEYYFDSIFRDMLRWENDRTRTDRERSEVYSRTALYYELDGNPGKALEYYSLAGDPGKISDLLTENAELNPGVGYFREMQNYYYALPEEEILRSPSLMCAMSMLTSLCLDYETSERWYHELEKYAARLSKSDKELPEVKGKISYLDIALPQRGSKGLISVIRSVFSVMSNRKVKVPAFSVTSTLPSIMNGGKDFCEWSKKDSVLYATMRKPVEAILGRDGVGLAECAICESRFEKGQNVTEEMLNLMSRVGEIQSRGTPDIEFAVIGLLAKIQVSQNKSGEAFKTVENLRERFVSAGETRFLGNIDALLTRLHLRRSEMEPSYEWLRKSAPGNETHLWTLWRYQYMTRVMVQLTEEKYDESLLLLSRLRPYCDTCGRIMDGLHIRILTAICRQRLQQPWQEDFCGVLDTALEFSFVWVISQYGASILPLLRECGWNKNKEFMRTLSEASRQMAVYYPRFLKPLAPLTEPLSATETQVLHLICQNLTNAEIGEIMDIRLATVKTHIRNIFQKLDVSNRSTAKEKAEKLHLL